MVLSTLSMCSLGCLYFVPGLIAVPFYASNGHPRWAKTVLSYIPSWLLIGDSPDRTRLVRYLYEGTPSGAPIVPYHIWVQPMGAWIGILFLYFFTAVCVTGMFRRIWFRQEHIAFPLAELALAVGGGLSTWETRRGLFRDKLLWIGFVIPFLHACINVLSVVVARE